jgi:hypothetical protein
MRNTVNVLPAKTPSAVIAMSSLTVNAVESVSPATIPI